MWKNLELNDHENIMQANTWMHLKGYFEEI